MFPSLGSPPRYDAHTELRIASTSLKPYLQLPHILSLTWLAYPVISLLFVIFRLQISSTEAQSAAANAKDDLLSACQAAEHAATSAASMPRYLAIATNRQFADAVNGTMNGAREALILALTCMEAIINFLISIYRSTFLCFLELVVGAGLGLLIKAVQDITSFLQNTLNSVVSGLKDDATTLNSAIQTVVNSINTVNPFGKINAPQFNVSRLDALSNITIPTTFETDLIKLNSSLPTVSSIKSTIQDLVDTPFEAVKADINSTLLGLTFDPELLPVPAQNAVSFCGGLNTLSVDNLAKDLLRITKIGTAILAVLLFLLLAGHCVVEWYKWRCLMKHLQRTREAWMSDPTISHDSSSRTTPSVTLSNHNLLMLQAEAQHPLLTRIAYTLAARLHFTPSQHAHLRWFLHYIFHPPALACFLIGFFGLLSVQIQLIAIGPLEAHYTAEAAASVQDLSNTIATQMNNSMYNQSAAYANEINAKVEIVQSTINNGLFGWVNGTTTTLNTTLNNFYTDVRNLVGTIFNGTVLETPTQDFIKCLIGSKVNAIEEALTFLNQNLRADLPQVNETILVLSPNTVNEIIQPISTAAIGGGSNNSQGLVGRLVSTYVNSLKKERLLFGIFMGLWAVVVLMGLIIVLWHSYIKNRVDAYKTRKWQKEQQDGFEGVVAPLGHGVSISRARDTEKGHDMTDSPPRSFTPLPEAHSPLNINLFRRPNQDLSSFSHPLQSLKPAFEKSWDSFSHERADYKQPDRAGLPADRPMKFTDLGKGDERVETSEGNNSDTDKPKSVWFKPVIRLFSRKKNVQVDKPASNSCTPHPQLAISVERVSTATARALPEIDDTPSPAYEEPSSRRLTPLVAPTPPWVKNVPPRKAVPLTTPPPPPGLSPTQNADIRTDISSAPGNGPLAMPLHNAFEVRPLSQKPARLVVYPPLLAPHSETARSYERHKHSSSVPVPITPSMVVSRHQPTSSTSRLLTNMHVRASGDPADPFSTPFDDDASVADPVGSKRSTTTGFAL